MELSNQLTLIGGLKSAMTPAINSLMPGLESVAWIRYAGFKEA
jgi:hypothetical protein